MKKSISFGFIFCILFGCGLPRMTNNQTSIIPDEKQSEKILFQNGSFENHEWNAWNWMGTSNSAGKAEIGIPENWISCGEPVMIYQLDGIKSKYHRKSVKAYDGRFYLGLAINEEAVAGQVSQQLSAELEAGKSYQLSFYTAFAKKFRHWYYVSKYKQESYQYKRYLNIENEPVLLKIWSSNDGCEQEELIYVSEPIDNEKWEMVTVKFSTQTNYRFLIFEVAFPNGTQNAYNGNILIDNISDVEKIIE